MTNYNIPTKKAKRKRKESVLSKQKENIFYQQLYDFGVSVFTTRLKAFAVNCDLASESATIYRVARSSGSL